MKTATGGLALAVILAAVVAQPAFSQRYTVLTYNTGLLRVLGNDMVPVVPARARLVARELAAFVAAATPDIILLEEAWKNSTASAIAKALTPLGYTSIRPRGCNPFCLGSGLLVLLREPLRVVDWDFAAFTKRPGLEVVSAKGVFTSVVEDPAAGGARFALVGTHMTALDTIDGEPKDKGQLDAFLSQAAQVVAALDSVSGGGTLPVILLGDFNVGPGYATAGYKAIAGAGGIAEAGEQLFPGSPLITWDPANPLVSLGRYPLEPAAKIDHVFLRSGASRTWQVQSARRVLDQPVESLTVTAPKSSQALASPLSDHYGFLVEVEAEAK